VNRPDHHAVETQETNHEDRLHKHPHQPRVSGKDAEGKQHPKPASHCCPREHRGPDGGNNHEAGNTVELIGGVKKKRRLPALHDISARKKWVDVTAWLSPGQGELIPLAREGEGCEPGPQAVEQNKEGHARLPLRGVVHALIMTPHPEKEVRVCDTGLRHHPPNGLGADTQDFLDLRSDEG
jgi:hypothetical protein